MQFDRPDIRQERLARILVKSSVASLDAGGVMDVFDTTFEQDYWLRRQLLLRLKELVAENERDRDVVGRLIDAIQCAAEHLPAPKARSADGATAELLFLLSEPEQLSLAADLVSHARYSRRASGYRVIKKHGHHNLKHVLAESFRKYRDEQALVTLISTNEDITDILEDPAVAIRALKERYHQALAIERAWNREDSVAWALADEFPMAFIWAAGRRGESSAREMVLGRLSAEFDAMNNALDVHTYIQAEQETINLIWALGRVGALDELERLAREYNVELPHHRKRVSSGA